MTDPGLLVYYAARAAEYEKVYEKPERRADLEPGSLVVFADNRCVEGSNWPITRTDGEGNTYQHRYLENGAEYDVLKNFPSSRELRSQIEAAGGIVVPTRASRSHACAVR